MAAQAIAPWKIWAGLDSNQRRRKPADLQSAPFGHFGTYPFLGGRLATARLRTRTPTLDLNSENFNDRVYYTSLHFVRLAE